MVIYIPAEDLNPEVYNLYSSPSILADRLFNLGIDYATNTLEAMDKTTRKEYELINFTDYDMKLSNRGVDYKVNFIRVGEEVGVRLEMWSTRN